MTLIPPFAKEDRFAPLVEAGPDALERSGFGVALLNGCGDLICISSQGRRLLGTPGLSATASDAKWLRQALARLLANREGAHDEFDDWLTLPSTHDRHMAVRLAMISDGEGDLRSKMIMLIFVDLAAAPKIDPIALRRIFGLTAAEAEVAARIGRGETLNKIARDKGVSIPTLRSQLAAVFGKTGTKRQTQLALLLARLAILP